MRRKGGEGGARTRCLPYATLEKGAGGGAGAGAGAWAPVCRRSSRGLGERTDC